MSAPDDDSPIRMRSNEYWGKQSGVIDLRKGPIFPGRRGSVLAHQEHQGPHGNQLRFYAGRACRRKLGKHGLKRQHAKV